MIVAKRFLTVFVVAAFVVGGALIAGVVERLFTARGSLGARLLAGTGPLAGGTGDKVDYNRDVRPILAANCYACHGPDARLRKARLRLDQKDGALGELRGGRHAIVPGDPSMSSLVQRISSADEDEVMPPPDSGKELSPAQIETLRRWIEEGAAWSDHWAYVPPARHAPPGVALESWPSRPVDRFILARLEKEGLQPSPEADRVTLLRRLSFDLIGLPPAPAAVDAFLSDTSEAAWEKQVDRLLRSPHYGERMAVFWLDLVRFADTRGFHSDNPRNVHPYRDYVIGVFNENLPFDQFTIEQLAGDLLPEPTLQQRLATCYNKLNQTTEEGGAQAGEYEAKNSSDRVRNVSAVWMGATLGCAECHEHKFDPYAAGDFYRMAAFFADIKEPAITDRDQGIPLPTPEEDRRLGQLEAQLASLEKELADLAPERAQRLARAQSEWEKDALGDAPLKADGLPPEIRAALEIPAGERDEKQKASLAAHYRSIAPELAPEREELAGLRREKEELEARIARCLVSVAGDPRVVRILTRGNWMDTTGDAVQPAIPAYFGRLETGERRANRMDLARWLVSPANPLTARVFVNRLWKLFFGVGISRRLDDLGAMGEPPVHPALLDWLAVEFMESGWDVKHMVKLLVMSSTYRQSSVVTADLRERDPYNRLLARQSRWRLDAEMVRDNALAVSGLLSLRVGGPSVKPYQPDGYWMHLNFPKRTWTADEGERLYRRGLYTWWQRSFLHPSLMAFDAPSREECSAERPRSNIPQQALVLLNDPTYVEAARVFAYGALREGGETARDRIRWAMRRAVSRSPVPEEIAVLADLYEEHRAQYEADPRAAVELLAVGEAAVPDGIAPAELAAWTSVARAILNLHETVTRN